MSLTHLQPGSLGHCLRVTFSGSFQMFLPWMQPENYEPSPGTGGMVHVALGQSCGHPRPRSPCLPSSRPLRTGPLFGPVHFHVLCGPN